jgi:hypothetical protein
VLTAVHWRCLVGQVAAGLREALNIVRERKVGRVGAADGFNPDLDVKTDLSNHVRERALNSTFLYLFPGRGGYMRSIDKTHHGYPEKSIWSCELARHERNVGMPLTTS